MRSIKEVLDIFLKKLPDREKFKLSKVWVEWDRAAGKLSKIAYPLGSKKGILVVGVKDSMAMQELYFRKKELLNNIKEFLGYQPFNDVTVELLGSKTPLNKIKI